MNTAAYIESGALRKALQKAPDTTKKGIHSMLERSGIQTQGIMKTKVKTGVSGELKKSVKYFFTDYMTVAIEPTAKHAAPHEHGSKPHWVSVKEGTPLNMWAKAKGINPYALQKSIAKKGTKAHPFLQRTLNEVDSQVLPDFNKGISKIIERILE